MKKLGKLRKRYLRAKMLAPRVREIAGWLPSGLCLDSRPDAERLARMFKKRFYSPVTVDGIFQKLAYLPYCTDNEGERRLIAAVLARLP